MTRPRTYSEIEAENARLRAALETIAGKAALASRMCDDDGRAGGFRLIKREARAALGDTWQPEQSLGWALEQAHADKNQAYQERNRLVALLATIYPSGTKRTAIPGWDEEWHGCVYIDFPWGQASWHYHDSHAHLFAHLPRYAGEWDGHTTEQKYAAIANAAVQGLSDHVDVGQPNPLAAENARMRRVLKRIADTPHDDKLISNSRAAQRALEDDAALGDTTAPLVLSEPEHAAFVAALDNPPEPNAALRALAAGKPDKLAEAKLIEKILDD
jgi:hypothetical protein